MKVEKDKITEEKKPKEVTRIGDSLVFTQENPIKHAKLEAMMYMQKTWCRPGHAASFFQVRFAHTT